MLLTLYYFNKHLLMERNKNTIVTIILQFYLSLKTSANNFLYFCINLDHCLTVIEYIYSTQVKTK